MDDKLFERLDALLGEIFITKDDMRVLVHILKELEMLEEYKGCEESRYIIKVLLLLVKQIERDVDAAAKSIDEITK